MHRRPPQLPLILASLLATGNQESISYSHDPAAFLYRQAIPSAATTLLSPLNLCGNPSPEDLPTRNSDDHICPRPLPSEQDSNYLDPIKPHLKILESYTLLNKQHSQPPCHLVSVPATSPQPSSIHSSHGSLGHLPYQLLSHTVPTATSPRLHLHCPANPTRHSARATSYHTPVFSTY